jgi:hypothetical protein
MQLASPVVNTRLHFVLNEVVNVPAACRKLCIILWDENFP